MQSKQYYAAPTRLQQVPTTARRYFIGLLGCCLATGLHLSLQHFVGARIPFLFFLPAIIFVALLAGRGPAVLVMVAGTIYGAIVLPPAGLRVDGVADRTALLMYSLLGFTLAVVGAGMRITSWRARQQLEDLQQLHDLSTRLPRLTSSEEQLRLILQALVRLQGASRGLVSICDLETERISVAAHIGFSETALADLRGVRMGEGACGLSCLRKERVVIEDTEKDERFALFRTFARREGFRAVHSTPLLDHRGEILGAISTHFDMPHRPREREIRLADLCASKAAVFIERAQAEAQSRAGDERFRVVLESSAVPFFIIAPERDASDGVVDFRWVYSNAAAARVLGRSSAELVGNCMSEVFPNIWRDTGSFEHYLASASKSEVREFELELGSDASFHVVSSPLGSSVAVWWTDITERKKHERGLQEADRRKDEFLAVLAHELRNPLAPIRQAALIAKSPAATDEQKRWGQEVIERQVQNMSLLLDDLLDVSRITRGTLQLRKQHALLSAVVQSAVETSRPLFDSKRHTLTVECPPDVRVNVDPLRLSQVISNLLTNAAKYTNPGGAIRLTASVHGSDVTLTVVDNGIGLAADELGSIFGMFSQVRSAQDRSEGGLGIGLALTRGLVQLHGGTIEARSEGKGRGSTFSVRLPSAIVSSEATTPASGVQGARIKLSRRILIADDNRDAAESLAILLRMDGHEVFVANDGEQAYDAYCKYLPDVALLDIGMPRMSGYELARRIRAESEPADVLLIAITGWGQTGDRAKAAASGFDHHLTKPLDYSALAELLRPQATRVRLAEIGSVIRALDG